MLGTGDVRHPSLRLGSPFGPRATAVSAVTDDFPYSAFSAHDSYYMTCAGKLVFARILPFLPPFLIFMCHLSHVEVILCFSNQGVSSLMCFNHRASEQGFVADLLEVFLQLDLEMFFSATLRARAQVGPVVASLAFLASSPSL